MKRGLIIFLFLWNHAFAQQMITKVIELNYLPAEKVIELIQPLINQGEQISGSGNTLILKVSPQTLTDIRAVLHKIDVPPVSLKISIYQGDANWLAQQNSVVYSSNSRAQKLRSQSVTVMNGESAVVSTGQTVPVVQAVGYGFSPGVVFQQHNIQTGMLVSPLLQGSQVQLTIKRVRQQISAAGGQQFDNQQIDTTLMLPLDKWVSLGSAEGASTANANTTVYTSGRRFSQNSTLYVKVSRVSATGN